MLTQHVVFSFFRYRRRHTLLALIKMGFQGRLMGSDLPAGDIRLMGCGSGDGFSIWPNLRAYCLMCAAPEPADFARLQRTRFYRWVAGPSIEQLHFVLEPLSGHGTWDGESLFDYTRQPVGDQPFAVLTHARVARPQARAFWRSVPSIRRHLREVEGCLYHIGFGEHPLLTLATFSIWNDLQQMQTFAYRHTPHHDASKAARREGWLAESMFVRFAIRRIFGDVARYPALAELPAAQA